MKINKDKLLREYIELSNIFRGILNGFLFEGNEIIKENQLLEEDSVIVSSKNKKERRRDSVRRYIEGNLKIGIEIQSEVDYAMPIRVAEYDIMEYHKNIRHIKGELENKGISYNPVSNGLPGMKLTKSITIVLYVGDKPWDGPTTITEMLSDDIDEIIKEDLKNCNIRYPMCIIDAKHMLKEDIKKYKGDIGLLFQVLNFDEDENNICDLTDIIEKSNIKYYKTYEVMSLLTGDVRYIEYADQIYKSKEEEIDMCGLLDYVERRGVIAGIEEGKIEGKLEVLLSLVKDNIISVKEAAKRAGKSEEEFREAAKRI